MDIKFFSDIIDTLEKVGKGVIALKKIPEKQRKKYREAIGETYTILNSALNLVLNRLGDIMLLDQRADFFGEVKRLDNFEEWRQIEREVRLCSNLRAAGREMKRFGEKFLDKIALRNQESYARLVYQVLEQGESELADLISESLHQLAEKANKTPENSEGYKKLKRAVKRMRDAFRKERMKLISAELNFYKQI